ncbi:Six-hairpin glycosidase [Fistulina hepatica ATCC 64428]|uniref:Six-hairpin glycosidase n=1 Tax=Fistulina hepatica ATCC 64428 TaxID=1128425 RepID=A0A0D7AMW5_9AGAR|nr:Six-hairpin glycosidase [Fistulina hepatica ATCC 64428]
MLSDLSLVLVSVAVLAQIVLAHSDSYAATDNLTYHDYILAGATDIVADDGSIVNSYDITDYALDPLRISPTLLYLYACIYHQIGYAKRKTAAETYMTQLRSPLRMAEGQFWHKLIYPNQSIFHYGNSTAWDDIKIWDRVVGWSSMLLADIIPVLSSHYKGVYLSILRYFIPKLVDAADEDTGIWWLAIMQPDHAGNYFKSSDAAMFVYSMLKSVRFDHLSDEDGSIVAAAVRAYEYMVENRVIESDVGIMNWENSFNRSFEYCIEQPVDENGLKGLAAFLLASLEYEQLYA